MTRSTILIPFFALLTSCAVLQNPALNQVVIAGAVSAALAHTPDAQRALVARDVSIASNIYSELAGPEGIPTPAQFAAALDKYLPNDASKELAQAALNALYATYYPTLAAKVPKDQVMYLNAIMAGFKAGALPYVK